MSGEIYLPLKLVHVLCAAITLLFFLWRSQMVFSDKSMPRLWQRHIPDMIDTLLLGTGAGLLFVIGLSPLAGDWISIKLIMVVIYILLGMIVLHFGKTPAMRRLAWLGALLAFACIVWLAHFKDISPLAT